MDQAYLEDFKERQKKTLVDKGGATEAFHRVLLVAFKEISTVKDHAAQAKMISTLGTALINSIANLMCGYSLTAANGNRSAAKAISSFCGSEIAKFSDQFIDHSLDDTTDKPTTVIQIRNGQEVPFDFRDHIKPDSGRMSDVGGE